MTTTTTTMNLEECRALVATILEANGTSPQNAKIVASALVLAEADGLKGHGLSRVASYAEQARVGKADGQAEPLVEAAAGAILKVDAGNGFAYPAIELALRELCAPLDACGAAVVAVARSHHAGVLGHVVERIAEEHGAVALMVANTPGAIAAWGGSKPLFGTNPIAFAAPMSPEPLVIDLSLSKVARGNILKASQAGEPIPEGWALDEDGVPTTDAERALKGTMVPMGDAKGVALAFMVEVLAASLTGANYSFEASSFLNAKGGPPGTGQLIIAIAPGAMGASADHLARLAKAYLSEPGTRLPGARRRENRARAMREGIEVPGSLLAMVKV